MGRKTMRGLCGPLAVAAALAVTTPAGAAAQDAGEDIQTLHGRQESTPDVRAAIADSLKLVMLEHTTRIAFQEKTRAELGGPFFKDYVDSVRFHRQWGDGDGWLVNYVGHPIHGAASGFIWDRHDPASADEDLGLGRRYWTTRWRPLAWMAGYSLQFEIGPLSEASIGNVGLRPETTGWVDHVVTPIGGLGFMVLEDTLDRTFITWFEDRVGNPALRAVVRCLFNPSRMLANVSSSQLPWHRELRSIRRPTR